MLKSNLILILLLAVSVSFAQEIERVKIDGRITAPPGEDLEGISLYNVSAQVGTVTQIDGTFTLNVGVNDRILVTALQFQKFTLIVDQGVVDSEKLNIYLNPSVTQLDEVIVRPYDLTGNVKADINRVNVRDANLELNLSYGSMEFDYDFRDDAQSSVRGNAAAAAISGGEGLQYGFNPLGLLGLLFNKDKANGPRDTRSKLQQSEAIAVALRQRYSVYFYEESFGIPQIKVDDFIYFVQDNGMDSSLLKSQNELELIAYLKAQSVLYLDRVDD